MKSSLASGAMLYNRNMPFNYAHACIGLCALQSCINPRKVGIISNEDAFFLGTMGPDPYYGDAYPPSFTGARTDLADRLHAYDLFGLTDALIALSEGNRIRTAYTMGFLCHVLLDNRVHPYIEARYPGVAHSLAEIAMDMSVVQRANEPRLSVSPEKFYKLDSVQEIDALHTEFFATQCGLSTRGVYARSLKKWLRLNALLYDPHGRKRALLRAFPKLTRYCIAPRPEAETDELLNLSHAPWSPTDTRTASVPELMDSAREEISQMLDVILSKDRAAMRAALEGRNADAAGILSE